MSRTPRLPHELRGTSLAARDLPEHGVPRRRAIKGDLTRPYHGLRAVELQDDTVLSRCRAIEPLLGNGVVITHTTALELWGAPRFGVSSDLHLSVEFPRTPPRGLGVVGHSLARIDPAMTWGLPVSSAEAAWCQAAQLLSANDLVAAADALVTGPRVDGVREAGVTSLDALGATLASWPRSPGLRKLRWALVRARSGVDSIQETRTRLLLVSRGLTEPEVDVEVDVGGGLVLHSDLGYPEARIAIEYEGDEHRRSRRRWLSDVERHERMRAAGWTVFRVTAPMLHEPGELVGRIRGALSFARAKRHL